MCPAIAKLTKGRNGHDAGFTDDPVKWENMDTIIQPNSAVCADDASGLINGRKQRGTTWTLALKVKGTGRQKQEEAGTTPTLDLACWPQVLARAPVLSFPLDSSHTTHKMERHMVAFSPLGVNVSSNLSSKP